MKSPTCGSGFRNSGSASVLVSGPHPVAAVGPTLFVDIPMPTGCRWVHRQRAPHNLRRRPCPNLPVPTVLTPRRPAGRAPEIRASVRSVLGGLVLHGHPSHHGDQPSASLNPDCLPAGPTWNLGRGTIPSLPDLPWNTGPRSCDYHEGAEMTSFWIKVTPCTQCRRAGRSQRQARWATASPGRRGPPKAGRGAGRTAPHTQKERGLQRWEGTSLLLKPPSLGSWVIGTPRDAYSRLRSHPVHSFIHFMAGTAEQGEGRF